MDTDTQGRPCGLCRVRGKVEVMHLQAKEHQGLPAATRNWVGQERIIP